ncbi:hypothetical protein A4X06_0g4352 [Tilletia controversa]|uniref:Uncharacterized protein n=1 Tax=Tilletia controversa TaxID=13291 RepID=A0A8X7MSV3_9BASI|nr:hypothetical protein CF335_g7649 [Tilletia laevis]KAE8247577.1 hypothetical protein A4X06_0g4352 [Tilletia controversa]
MQIRRFSHLFSFLPVVLIGSIALAMVAGAPASADLEQHTAESFLNLPNLEGMSLKALNELLEIKTKLYESHLNAMRRLEAYGGTAAERKAAVDILRNDAVGVKTDIDTLSKAISKEMESWGTGLRLGIP